ncbi:MAG: hypothetical protein MZV70_70690 [Desulfobacterales bacterium]|nr:hypothetical protein [Desulfobacterales bacterium]
MWTHYANAYLAGMIEEAGFYSPVPIIRGESSRLIRSRTSPEGAHPGHSEVRVEAALGRRKAGSNGAVQDNSGEEDRPLRTSLLMNGRIEDGAGKRFRLDKQCFTFYNM